MLNFGPHSQADLTNSPSTTTEAEEKTPTHAVRQEPHLYRPKRKCNSVTQEGQSRWSNRRGGFLAPQGTGLSDLEDRKQQVCSDSMGRRGSCHLKNGIESDPLLSHSQKIKQPKFAPSAVSAWTFIYPFVIPKQTSSGIPARVPIS